MFETVRGYQALCKSFCQLCVQIIYLNIKIALSNSCMFRLHFLLMVEIPLSTALINKSKS